VEAHERAPAPDSGELDRSLVWIWGSPRSGSTWLLKLLSDPLDPDPELPLGFAPRRDAEGPFDVVPFDETFISNHLAPALADPRLVEGRWMPGTLNNLLAPKPTYVYSDEHAGIWIPAARQFIRARIGGVLERARNEGVPLSEAPLIVIKETNGSHAADLVMRVLPSSRLLLLIRDGRDVVDSLLHAYQPGGFFARNQGRAFTTAEERVEGLRWAARLWACNTDVTLKAIEAHPDGLARVVRYEDLLTDTLGEVRSLVDWLGLERAPETLEQLVATHSFSRIPSKERGPLTRNRAASPGLWRDNLSREEQRTVNEICGPLLERFGYEL
jgi:hypothetical protein